MAKEEFIRILADQVPDPYCHSIRYYGLLAPRAKSSAIAILFKLLGQSGVHDHVDFTGQR
jgi:hypothetical protein